MRTIILFVFFTFSGIAAAQDIQLSKQDLIDILSGEMAEGVCTQDLLDCLDLSKAACSGETDTLVNGACSKQIPEGGAGIDAISDLTTNVTNCVISDILSKYKQNMVKNISTRACKAFMQ